MMRKEQEKEKQDSFGRLYNALDVIRFFFIITIVLLLSGIFIGKREEVSGTSMYPTLKDKEQVILNVAASFIGKIKRFDVVVAKNYESKDLWVKRVIGLPGDEVEYKNDVLYINGEKIEEPFLDKAYIREQLKERKVTLFTNNFSSQKLKSDEYLLVGDNRLDSLDSRSARVGPFKREQIIADGMFVYYPLSEMRYVGNGSK